MQTRYVNMADHYVSRVVSHLTSRKATLLVFHYYKGYGVSMDNCKSLILIEQVTKAMKHMV